MTILKGERIANLHKMKGSIIISDASTTTEKEDITRLWYMHLGQMSERNFQILHKKGALLGIKYYKFGLCKFCVMGK